MAIYEILSPSGRETAMGEYIKSMAEEMGYSCRFDTFGNLICGEGDVTIECGMDTVCFMKTAQTEDGMIKIAVPSTGLIKMLIGKKVRFLNGVCGVIRCDKTEDIEDFDLSVDIGASRKEEALNAVPTGEFGSISCDRFETEKFIFGNGISNYAQILIMLEVMKKAKDKARFVFSASRKLGGRGLRVYLSESETKTIISLMGTKENADIKCQKGAAVVIKEKGAVPDVELRKALIGSAGENCQLLASGENLYLDYGKIYGKGTISGGIALPVRDMNGSYEAVAKSDIKSAVNLLSNYLKVD